MQNRFKHILQKYLSNKANSKEIKAVDDFVTYLQERPLIDLKEIEESRYVKNNIYSKIKYRTIKRKKRKQFKFLTLCLIALLISGISIYRFSQPNEQQFVSTSNSVKTIELLDGTIVKLFTNSSLIVSKDFNKSTRKVKLIGEAFFKVSKDSGKPFIITSNNFETSVLGTSFFIKKDMVSVSTGKVKVSNVFSKDNYVILEASDKVWLSNNKLYKDSIQPLLCISSNSPSLIMDNISIKNWKQIISKEFDIDVQLNIVNDIAEISITGDFRNSTLESIVQSMGFVNNLDYKYENNTLIINNK